MPGRELITGQYWSTYARSSGDWSQRIQRYYHSLSPLYHVYEDLYKYRANEPGFTHPHTGASVRLRDDGCVDIFCGEHVGIRMDPNAKSVNVFAEKFNVWSTTTSIHTDRDKFLWNYNPINPEIYEWQVRVDNDMWPWIGPYHGQRRRFKSFYEYEQYDEPSSSWITVNLKLRPYMRNREAKMKRLGQERMTAVQDRLREEGVVRKFTARARETLG